MLITRKKYITVVNTGFPIPVSFLSNSIIFLYMKLL